MSLNFLRIGSVYLREGEKRLDASYYALAVRARWELEKTRWPLRPLGEVAHIFYPGRFKRPYAPKGKGVPFVGSREMFFWPLQPRDFLYGTLGDWRNLMVKRGWVLVSRSGTVGQVLLVSRDFTNVAVTEDAVRLESKNSGYIYAFLRSRYGRDLLQGYQFGAVIKHLEPEQIGSFLVPILPEKLQERIHAKMLRALTLRERGSCLLKKAQRLLYGLLGLPDPDTLKPGYLPNPPGTKVPTFSVKRSELEERLDGSYHLPEVKSLLRVLKAGKYPLAHLKDLTAYIHIPPRFKRHYVDPAKGVPFVRPSDLATVRILERRYIAKWTPELDQLRLHQGEVLISTDGAIGDMGYVTQSWDGWAGSNNIGRIKASGEAHPGYLYAFLVSPYGQLQFKREIYGGVIDHLEEEHLAKVLIPKAPLEIQETIGKAVLQAFDLREKANSLEEEAISELEELIARGPRLKTL
ncbi:MAG: restriction endonuclease subunit S [Thermus sp.]|uniref:restriction endonuclease subunit S n=1 Tax=Thermus sp. TaxID=275 RepID=UPI00391C6DF6